MMTTLLDMPSPPAFTLAGPAPLAALLAALARRLLLLLLQAINPVCTSRTAPLPSTLATFGQPRTGNPAFAAGVETALASSKMAPWRVVHHADFAPAAIPRLLDGKHYKHIGREVWFSENNQNYSVCDGTGEDPSCSASVPKLAIRVLDHEQYMGYVFSSPCGGPSQNEAIFRYICYGGGVSFLCFLVFVVRCRRCQRLRAMPAGLLAGGHGINSDSYYA